MRFLLVEMFLACATVANAWVPSIIPKSRLSSQSTKVLSACDTSASPLSQQPQQGFWSDSNVHNISSSFVYSGKNPWHELLPAPWSNRGCDVTIEFDNFHEGARQLASSCYAASFPNRRSSPPKIVISLLEEALGSFLRIEGELNPEQQLPKCKARIVSSRGSTGTKCPRWHMDHVPFRYIQSLVGAGCSYVEGEQGLNRDALNQLDIIDTPVQKLNALMVDEKEAHVRQAQEGQAVLIMGKAWAHQVNQRRNSNRHFDEQLFVACVHKSPELLPWEGRILLTIDVVTNDET